ncbi:FAD-dependent thymidylate synthase [Amnibacterium kyonggiense]
MTATEPEFRSEMTVELVRSAARDADVLFAARVSTLGEQSLESTEEEGDLAKRDRGLINYLMRDRHGSPFEHNSMTFYVQAPIFVFREFMRHRIASYNEESGRYRELQPVFYVPAATRNLVQVGKPGAYEFLPGTEEQHALVQQAVREQSVAAYDAYRRMLDAGVAREVARVVLPLNLYSSMYVTMNARSLMNFISLRTKHPEATVPSFPQREIELVAEAMETRWATLMPATHAAFTANGRVAP